MLASYRAASIKLIENIVEALLVVGQSPLGDFGLSIAERIQHVFEPCSQLAQLDLAQAAQHRISHHVFASSAECGTGAERRSAQGRTVEVFEVFTSGGSLYARARAMQNNY